MNPWILLGALLAFIGAYWLGDHNGAGRARDKAIAEQSVKQDTIAVETDRRAIVSSEASTNMLDYLASIPQVQARANESAERIRVIYRDVPNRCVPVRPARVQAEIDAAYRSATAATGAMPRPSPESSADSPKP